MTQLFIKVLVEVDDEFFDNIVTTMLEGGSNYWIKTIQIHHPDGEKPKGIPLSTWAASALNKGGFVMIQPQDEIKHYRLEMKDLWNGLHRWIESKPGSVPVVVENGKTTIDAGDIDANDADAILQYALFGILVFG
jgi:hypothetical protein